MFNVNPRALDAASFILKAVALSGIVAWAYRAGETSAELAQAKAEQQLVAMRTAAADGAADAIKEIRNDPIPQQIIRTVREVPVYRDCAHPERVLNDLNRQLSPTGSRAD